MKGIFTSLLLVSCLIIQGQSLRLSGNWYLKSSLEVSQKEAVISNPGFNTSGWYSVTMPSTVLNALVKQGVYPDPRMGMNNFLIPDVSDSFNVKYNLSRYSYLQGKQNPWKDPYWYRTEMDIPSTFKGKQIWLIFNGINYRAELWVNGRQVAGKTELYGMFRRFRLNITDFAKPGARNCIAVKVYQVDHPGDPNPGTQFEVFGNTRGHAVDIFKDETLKISGGWDCAPVVRDRNMGIYQDVFLEATGPVSVLHPYVTTTLPLPDTSKASIHLETEVANTSTWPIHGLLVASIHLINDPDFPAGRLPEGASCRDITIRQQVDLQPGETQKIIFSPENFPDLTIKNPPLWYPNGYGKQYLHQLTLTFKVNHQISDERKITFGMRQVTTSLKRIGNDFGRVFYINGKRIFCRGGWLQPDILLNTDREKVMNEARLLADAHVNIVGNEDAPAPSEEVLESYDKFGIMYWEVFFQCWRMYPGSDWAHFPLDHNLAVQEVQDILCRYRNNPSVIAWFAANEVMVDESLYLPTREAVKTLDPSRPFIPTTSIDWDVEKLTPYIQDDLPTGTTDDGAPDYNWNPPAYFFDKVEEVHLQMFRNELGVPAIPEYNSLQKFIPTLPKHLESGQDHAIFPLDSIWAEHGAWDGNNYCFRNYDNAIRCLWGKPETARAYVQHAQMVNADSYRAMFEAANHRMWDITTGVMLWKLNSCWPDVGWQILDWFQQPNAAYFYAKKAMEPIHIQMNANDRMVALVNTTPKTDSVQVDAEVYDFNLKLKWGFSQQMKMKSDGYQDIVKVPVCPEITPVYFVKLRIKDHQGVMISDNFYWLCSQHEDFTPLLALNGGELEKTIVRTDFKSTVQWKVRLLNNTKNLSFFRHLRLVDEKSGEEILPAFWSDNYINLFPGEQKEILIEAAKLNLENKTPCVIVE